MIVYNFNNQYYIQTSPLDLEEYRRSSKKPIITVFETAFNYIDGKDIDYLVIHTEEELNNFLYNSIVTS